MFLENINKYEIGRAVSHLFLNASHILIATSELVSMNFVGGLESSIYVTVF